MRILISGAGIAGPTLAWFLAKTGARITILEKSPTLPSQGQNIDMSGTAITVMEKMGVLDKIRQLNTTEKGTQLIDPKGRPFAPFPVREGGVNSPTSEYEIMRGDLAIILYDATKNQPNIDYVFGTTVKRIVSNDDKSVKVELSDGQIQEYDLLVAADGQWSKIRKQCFPAESIKVVDKNMYIAYFTVPRLPSDNDWWNVYQALKSRLITLRPDPHGTTRAMLSLMPCNDTQKKLWQETTRKDRRSQEDLVRSEFADAGWQAQRLLDNMSQSPDFYLQAIQQIRMPRWSTSRVVCVGDAAYAPTPLSGQGTTLAIDGAYVLAGEISKLKDGENPAKACEAYDAAFRPFVEKIQNTIPSFVPAIAHPETAGKRFLFRAAITVAAKVAAIPWVSKDKPAETKDDYFPLPPYPLFDIRLHT